MSPRLACLATLAALALSACTLVTSFDRADLAETTEALCSDGLDDDGNGLADCQDWSCQGRRVCCNIPAVVLEDSFDGPACASASCAQPPACAPSDARWIAWGSPLPLLCEDALLPRKADDCYPIGVLSRTSAPLAPGLVVAAHTSGRPEPAAHLELALTLQNDASGSLDVCAVIDPVVPVFAVRLVAATGGVRFVASFQQADMGSTAALPADVPHEARIEIGEDRLVHFLVDGVEFATSPHDDPLPAGQEPSARVALSGKGLTARFQDVRVTTGTQCEALAAWQPAPEFLALSPRTETAGWDSFSVFAPTVLPSGSDGLDLYYSGCDSGGGGDCDTLSIGMFLARAQNGLPFRREGDSLLFLDDGILWPGKPTLRSPSVDFAVYGQRIYASWPRSPGLPIVRLPVDDAGVPDPTDGTIVLPVGPPGSWDDDLVCCASLAEQGGVLHMWYAGRSKSDATWRIGHARSTDGTTFERSPAPVLREGDVGAFDDRGVNDPAVRYDADRRLFVMWYGARAYFGTSSIGYAVSPDGVTWFKSPVNPVISAEGVGLESIGGPSVLVDEGRQRMWVHGREAGALGLSIYELTNEGTPFVPDARAR